MKFSNKRAMCLFLSTVLFSLFSRSNLHQVPLQEKKDKNTLQHEITVTLKLVQVYVTDKKGNPVVYLKKDDFLVYDDGKEKQITEFEKHIIPLPSSETEIQSEIIKESSLPAPRELMTRKYFLLFDFAYNNAKGIKGAKKAALHFIDSRLQPPDEIGVLSYSAIKSLTLHEYLTTDREKVRNVVQSFGIKDIAGRAENFEEEYWRGVTGENPLDASQSGKVKQSDEAGIIAFSPEFQKHILQQDSNIHAIHFVKKMNDFAKALRYIPGYKHIILFSSGIPYSLMYGIHQPGNRWNEKLGKIFDLGNRLLQQRYEDMLKELAASNSTVYSLDTEDLGSTIAVNSRVKGGFTLQTMASSTGGKYFGNINNYENHMEKIQNLTGCFYVLGFYVDEKWDGKYHKIKVKVNRRDCEVHAQKGYFNPKPFSEYSKLEKTLHLVDLALSEDPLFQTPVRFPLVVLPCVMKGKTNLALYSKINMESIQDLSGKEVEIVSIIFDNKDNIVKIERDEKDLSKLPKGKIYYLTLLPLDPGEYKCRIVIRNLGTGKGAVASSPVKVPKSPDSGIQLYSPLLLKPEKDAFYLKKPSTAYSFDYGQYSPLIEELEQGTKNLFAVVRCSFSGIEQPDIKLTANLIHHLADPGKTIPAIVSILNKYREDDTEVFLIELQTRELQPGEYFLYFFAKDSLTQSHSYVNTTFKIK